MDNSWMAKHLIDFQKTTFNNSYNTMVMLQDHSEKMANTFFDQADWFPEEGRKLMDQWAEAYKKGRDGLKNVVDDNFDKLAEGLATEK
jgi:hypothetical protein